MAGSFSVKELEHIAQKYLDYLEEQYGPLPLSRRERLRRWLKRMGGIAKSHILRKSVRQ